MVIWQKKSNKKETQGFHFVQESIKYIESVESNKLGEKVDKSVLKDFSASMVSAKKKANESMHKLSQIQNNRLLFQQLFQDVRNSC